MFGNEAGKREWEDVDMEARRARQNAHLGRDHEEWGGCAEAKISREEAREIYKRLNWGDEFVGSVKEDYPLSRGGVRSIGERLTWRAATKDLVQD